MTFYRIEYRAHLANPGNVLHVLGEDSRDVKLAQLSDIGCTALTVTELTAAEYRAVVLASLERTA